MPTLSFDHQRIVLANLPTLQGDFLSKIVGLLSSLVVIQSHACREQTGKVGQTNMPADGAWLATKDVVDFMGKFKESIVG